MVFALKKDGGFYREGKPQTMVFAEIVEF